jgi:hypothetical protein
MGRRNIGWILDSYAVALGVGTTTYVEIPIEPASIAGIQCSWLDATSSATITLETSNWPQANVAGNVAGNADEWFSETTVTITGPTAAARGCSMTHIGNLGSERSRLKIVTAAATKLRIRVSAKVP